MEKEISKKYSNHDITVLWQPHKCIHSAICFKGLGNVFNPRTKPWINMEGGTTDEIISQIKMCPSGALSYEAVNPNDSNAKIESELEVIIEPIKNGPLLVFGNVSLKSGDTTLKQKNTVTAFCRCGASQNKPYCDGSHAKINFEG
jgi:uncharacterized Fe-S cluster protein YjdI